MTDDDRLSIAAGHMHRVKDIQETIDKHPPTQVIESSWTRIAAHAALANVYYTMYLIEKMQEHDENSY